MPTLYFGGSFNPIHHGHLLCSRTVAELQGFERVVLIPSAQPPHKPANGTAATGAGVMAGAGHRLAMCRLAVAGSPGFAVDDLELRRRGPSYTLDTVQQLTDRAGEKPFWLIGADVLPQLPTWHRPDELLESVHFVLMARPGWTIDWSGLPPALRHLQSQVAVAPQIDISATAIRDRVALGRPIDFLTPPAVCNYIQEHGFYAGPPPAAT